MGDLAYENLAKDARDPGFEEDTNTLPNMTLLYEGAGRAVQAMWNATLSKLTQRRMFKGIQSGAIGETPKVNEERPNCDAWAQQVNGALAKAAQGSPDLQKGLQEDLNRMRQQCQQMSGVAWNKIDPRFEANDKAGGGGGGGGGNGQPQETLQFKGPEKEDPFQRDLRNQLEVLDKAGKNVQQLQTNWKYDKKDEQSTLKDYDNSTGQEIGERTVTVQDQLNAYNGQLEEAAKGMEEIQKRYPDYKPDVDATLGYKIAPNTRSVMDIDRPTQTMMEEFNASAPQAPVMPKNYDELLKTGGEPQ